MANAVNLTSSDTSNISFIGSPDFQMRTRDTLVADYMKNLAQSDETPNIDKNAVSQTADVHPVGPILPELAIDGVGKWFETRAAAYDKNGDSALSINEVVNASEHPLNQNDKVYLDFLRDNLMFFGSVKFDWGIFPKITQGDMREFQGWMGSWDRELNNLKKNSPEDYTAVNFLRTNFKRLDADHNGYISHQEVRDLEQSKLSESEQQDLKTLDARFERIAESTRISNNNKIFDKAIGHEKQIGAFEIARYTDDANFYAAGNKNSIFSRNLITDTNNVNAFTALESLRFNGYTVRRMYGQPEEEKQIS